MKYVKVKFRKAHPQFAYAEGNVGQVTEDNAALLLESGHVIMLPDDEDLDNLLPEDMPARDILFKAGYESIEKIREAGDSISEVKGIGKNLLKQIKDYLDNGNA
jgi:hypothetical protein